MLPTSYPAGMYGWTGFLGDFALFGPFLVLAAVHGVERAFPRLPAVVEARSPNLWFGASTLVMTLLCSLALTDAVTRFSFPLQPFSLADLPVPAVLKIVAGLIAIDFFFYLNHWVSHRVALLWRLHKVHHADAFVSASTGFLHHPLEVVWGFAIMLAVNVAFGIPLGAILIYGALNAVQLVVTHANVRLPERLSNALGTVLVTPDMHMVHHSMDMREGNANFGSILSVWDRLFGTFIHVPSADLARMEIGLPGRRPGDVAMMSLMMSLLGMPFRRD